MGTSGKCVQQQSVSKNRLGGKVNCRSQVDSSRRKMRERRDDKEPRMGGGREVENRVLGGDAGTREEPMKAWSAAGKRSRVWSGEVGMRY